MYITVYLPSYLTFIFTCLLVKRNSIFWFIFVSFPPLFLSAFLSIDLPVKESTASSYVDPVCTHLFSYIAFLMSLVLPGLFTLATALIWEYNFCIQLLSCIFCLIINTFAYLFACTPNSLGNKTRIFECSLLNFISSFFYVHDCLSNYLSTKLTRI